MPDVFQPNRLTNYDDDSILAEVNRVIEFTFRLNRRTSASHGKLFYRLAQQAVQTDPAPFATLVKPQPVAFGGVK